MSANFDDTGLEIGNKAEGLLRGTVPPEQPNSHLASAGFSAGREGGSPRTPRSLLIQIIEGEIIPRLFLAHRNQHPLALSGEATTLIDAIGDRKHFARLFMTGQKTEIIVRLQNSIDQGVPRERLYVETIAPVARMLSLLWEEGSCSFDEMANGLACIDQVLSDMNALISKSKIECRTPKI